MYAQVLKSITNVVHILNPKYGRGCCNSYQEVTGCRFAAVVFDGNGMF